jgi:hypothetical protein
MDLRWRPPLKRAAWTSVSATEQMELNQGVAQIDHKSA